jgi:hypothetical protein
LLEAPIDGAMKQAIVTAADRQPAHPLAGRPRLVS